ncbi:MAG: hypothetical protein ACN6RG_02055 [Stenotrophomonas sp.]
MEGESPYYDVTPPDDKAIWRLPIVSYLPPPEGAATIHPPASWPFRAIIMKGSPSISRYAVIFHVFDHSGTIIDSSDPDSIGDQMMEARVAGNRLWPMANVYYQIKPFTNTATPLDIFDNYDRISQPGRYAFVKDGDMLCPALDESDIVIWTDRFPIKIPPSLYLNGHCSESRLQVMTPTPPVTSAYVYPGFEPIINSSTSGISLLEWNLQWHDEPERPLMMYGECYAFCGADTSPAREPPSHIDSGNASTRP